MLIAAARRELAVLANRALDVPSYFREAGRILGRFVPYDGLCWFTMDPATALPTSHISERSIPPEQVPRLAVNEFTEPDVNKFTVLARRRTPAASLLRATRNQPETSVRYCDVLRPNSIRHELRAALVVDRLAWGGVALYRRRDDAFTTSDIRTVAGAAPVLGEGIRRSVARCAVGNDDHEGPGLMVLGRDNHVLSQNQAAKSWLDEVLTVPEPTPRAPIPDVIHAIAARARTGDDIARARLPRRQGGWLTADASLLDDTGETVAVVLQPSGPFELAAILVAAYGLTDRERDVASLVMRGLTNKEIAAVLYLSTYTVQDHVKHVLAKVGVRTRGELVASVFFEHYANHLADGTNLRADGWFRL